MSLAGQIWPLWLCTAVLLFIPRTRNTKSNKSMCSPQTPIKARSPLYPSAAPREVNSPPQMQDSQEPHWAGPLEEKQTNRGSQPLGSHLRAPARPQSDDQHPWARNSPRPSTLWALAGCGLHERLTDVGGKTGHLHITHQSPWGPQSSPCMRHMWEFFLFPQRSDKANSKLHFLPKRNQWQRNKMAMYFTFQPP